MEKEKEKRRLNVEVKRSLSECTMIVLVEELNH